MMTPSKPSFDRLIIGIILEMITVNRMRSSLNNCLTNKVGGLKIHISHPHRQYVRIAKDLLSQIILNTVSISAIDYFVKIVFHR